MCLTELADILLTTSPMQQDCRLHAMKRIMPMTGVLCSFCSLEMPE